MKDCLVTKRPLPRRSRCSSTNSVSTAETCSSSIYSSSRSLTIHVDSNDAKHCKRRVHFDSKTTEQYQHSTSIPAFMEELWYTPNEYENFRNMARQQGIVYRRQAGVVENLQAVYEVRGNLFQNTYNGKQSMTLEHAIEVLGSGLRGLEILVLKQMSVDRKAVLKGVLDMQTKLPCGLSENERTIAIAAKARFLSRQFRQFAQVQGRADALVVHNLEVEKE